MAVAHLETPIGIARIKGDEGGISGISISGGGVEPAEEIPVELRKAVNQLKEYFSGRRHNFELELNPAGTSFQKRVWQELIDIPLGRTISYFELSKRLGDVKAIRAVAAANGKNPLWIVIPCHRVIGSNGSLTGYAGGLWRKKWLLQHESPTKQAALF